MEDLTLVDYLAILKRRMRFFAVTAGIVFVFASIIAMQWSNYRSIATVEIEDAQIPAGVTTPKGMTPSEMLEAMADQRISQIQQKVTSTASLVDIITKFDLYSNAREKTPVADIADRMRNKIKVGLVSGAIANPAAANKESPQQLSAIAFTVSFDYSNPLLTQQVTNELVTRFLDEDLKMRRAQAEETSAFIDKQIEALEGTMVEQEKKIAEYHAEHGGSRPESLMFNQQAVQTTSLNIQTLDSQITANEGSQGSLRGQLASIDPYTRVIADGQVLTTPAIQLKALKAQYATLTAQYGPQHPDVLKAKHQIEALEAEVASHAPVGQNSSGIDTGQLRSQIADIQTNLKAAQKTYGDEHPDVIALKKQLESLQSKLNSSSTSSRPTLKNDADNPAYLELSAQLHSLEEQHKAMLQQRAALLTQQTKYQQALIDTPVSEKELASLTRDYENAQLRYRELKEKQLAARMEEQMEADRKGQRLQVINPPRLPLKTQPSRSLLILAGLMISMMAGAGVVILAEAIGQSIHGTRHLYSLLGVAPLVTVPYIFSPRENGVMIRLRRRFLGGL